MNMAAVFGREVSVKLLARAVDETGIEQGEALEHLRSPARSSRIEGEVVAFAHDRIREVGYRQLSPQVRRQLHRSAAEAISELRTDAAEAYPAELARHWDLAGDGERAPASLPRGRSARGGRGVHGRRGGEALPCLSEARDRTDAGRASWLGCRSPGTILNAQGRHEEALALFAQCDGEAAELGERAAQAECALSRGWIYEYTGRIEDSHASVETALQLFRDLEDRRGEGRALSSLAVFCWEQGRLEDGARLYEQSLAIYRDVGHRFGEASLLNNPGEPG